MDDHIVLRVVVRMLVPFILLFGLYIQFHGEYSPGGGFQAGVICASAFIVHALVNGLDKTLEVLSFNIVKNMSVIGVLLYIVVGVVSVIMGGNFLGYSFLLPDPITGQHVGIFLIELGVGITVFAVMMLIFYVFGLRA